MMLVMMMMMMMMMVMMMMLVMMMMMMMMMMILLNCSTHINTRDDAWHGMAWQVCLGVYQHVQGADRDVLPEGHGHPPDHDAQP
jgi:hypothetical protein